MWFDETRTKFHGEKCIHGEERASKSHHSSKSRWWRWDKMKYCHISSASNVREIFFTGDFFFVLWTEKKIQISSWLYFYSTTWNGCKCVLKNSKRCIAFLCRKRSIHYIRLGAVYLCVWMQYKWKYMPTQAHTNTTSGRIIMGFSTLSSHE